MEITNTNRRLADVVLTRSDFADALEVIPKEEMAAALTPFGELLARYGFVRTENLAETATAVRLGGQVVQQHGYDVVVVKAPAVQHKVEVKTLTSYYNSSGNITTVQQKVVPRLSTKKQELDYLLLEVVGMDQWKGVPTHIIYYLIPHHALYNDSGDFLTAFDVRLDERGYPLGKCKWTQWAFLDKSEIKHRLDNTPARISNTVDPKLIFQGI